VLSHYLPLHHGVAATGIINLAIGYWLKIRFTP